MNFGLLPGTTRPITNMGHVHIGPTTTGTTYQNALSMTDDRNDYYGIYVQNNSTGTTASTDIVAANNIANNLLELAYFDMGVNGQNNTNPYTTLFAANDAYLFTGGGTIGDINIATGTPGKNVKIGVGGLLAANLVATFGAQNQQMTNVGNVNNAVTVSSNAGTCSASYRLNTFTNSSAANMTITLSTSTPVDGQLMMVRIYDFSAVAKTITWVNTEDSTVTAPTTSNGSTTLPLTAGFMWNAATSKWRTIAKA